MAGEFERRLPVSSIYPLGAERALWTKKEREAFNSAPGGEMGNDKRFYRGQFTNLPASIGNSITILSLTECGIRIEDPASSAYSENRVGVSRNDAFKSTRASASGDPT
jgi:hypothetical protein